MSAWDAQLDLFERDLESADGTMWAPDPTLGPLPPHLVERAREIAARQLQRTAQLRADMAAVHDELGTLTHFVGVQADVTARVETARSREASPQSRRRG